MVDHYSFFGKATMKNLLLLLVVGFCCLITLHQSATAQMTGNIIITKTTNKQVYSLNEKATFIITVSNYSPANIIIDSIIDELPNGFTYKGFLSGSDINKTNSATYPSNECKKNLRFISNTAESGLEQYSVLSGESITLIYTAIACSTAQTNLKTAVTGYRNGTAFGSDENSISVYNVLPINILNISSYHNNNNNIIQWQSFAPESTRSFTLQYSTNGNDWTTIAETKVGCLNSNQPYQYIHRGMAKIPCHYRIVQEFCTGEKQFSKTIFIRGEVPDKTFIVKSNLINNGTIFVTTFNAGNLYLFNNQGAVVFHSRLPSGEHEIPSNSLPKGIYILTFNNQSVKIALQ